MPQECGNLFIPQEKHTGWIETGIKMRDVIQLRLPMQHAIIWRIYIRNLIIGIWSLAAYNCGSGRVARASKLHQTYDFWQMHSLPRESRNYIPYYLAAAIIAKTPKDYGFEIPKVNHLNMKRLFLKIVLI